ncbi:uncharacterized protein [Periplaneta americana]|uniref:uncharacterized protein isoform X6 n=1 Tax=Periplaneta americana TaxID=6978 RepID=UPI0037E725D6
MNQRLLLATFLTICVSIGVHVSAVPQFRPPSVFPPRPIFNRDGDGRVRNPGRGPFWSQINDLLQGHSSTPQVTDSTTAASKADTSSAAPGAETSTEAPATEIATEVSVPEDSSEGPVADSPTADPLSDNSTEEPVTGDPTEDPAV